MPDEQEESATMTNHTSNMMVYLGSNEGKSDPKCKNNDVIFQCVHVRKELYSLLSDFYT